MELFKNLPLPANEENYRHYERYRRFIESRPERLWETKKENNLHKHHIYPKSLGGSDNIENLILLTPREHFIAHMILYKCGYKEMISTFWYMTNSKRHYISNLSSRQYEVLSIETKRIIIENNTGLKATEETKLKLSESHKGKRHVSNAETGHSTMCNEDELEEYLSNGYTIGRPFLSAFMSGENNPMYGRSWKENKTEEEIQQHGINVSNGHSKRTKEQIAESNKKRQNSWNEKPQEEREQIYQYRSKRAQEALANRPKEEKEASILKFKKTREMKTEEAKQIEFENRRKANLGGNNPQAKAVICLETNEIFGSLKEASENIYGDKKYTTRIKSSILRKKPMFGFSWKYANE